MPARREAQIADIEAVGHWMRPAIPWSGTWHWKPKAEDREPLKSSGTASIRCGCHRGDGRLGAVNGEWSRAGCAGSEVVVPVVPRDQLVHRREPTASALSARE